MEQCDYVEIIEAISKLKKQVENIFIMSDVKKVYRNGYIKATTARACEKFKLYPIFKIQKNNFKIISARTGRLENVWKSYIRTCLFNKRKIDTRVLVITQIGCSVKQINFIKEEILKIIPFEKIIIQNGSCSNACYIGSGTIGIAYYLKE
jgi:fatty acid-binding protein DegV